MCGKVGSIEEIYFNIHIYIYIYICMYTYININIYAPSIPYHVAGGLKAPVHWGQFPCLKKKHSQW
jgi:hypothetical protein